MQFPITKQNGALPANQLTTADTGPNGHQQLRTDAAASWARMLAHGLPPGCLRSGYRTRAQQAGQVAAAGLGLNGTAAPVGTSQHGEGVAVDVDEPSRSWLTLHGVHYGWIANMVPGESWHFQYDVNADPSLTDAPAPVDTVTVKDTETMLKLADTLRLLRRTTGEVVAYDTTSGQVRPVTSAAFDTLAGLGIRDAMWFTNANGVNLDNMDPGPFDALVELLGGKF